MTTQPGPVIGGAVNINSLVTTPFVGDGVTFNFSSWASLLQRLYALSPELPVAVTLTSGTPCVVNWTAHGLKPNQAFYFPTGATLPSGVLANKPYFVTLANLQANSFTFSTVNNYSPWLSTVEGTPVNASGSSSNVTIVLTGRQWINLHIPPGHYITNNPANRLQYHMVPNGLSKVRIFAYGCSFDDLITPYFLSWPYNVPKTSAWLQEYFDLIQTTANEIPAQSGTYTITLLTAANTNKYYVGEWVCISGIDLMQDFGHLTSGPPNTHFFEFNQISAIDSVGGVLTLVYPLRNVYKATWPSLYNPSAANAGLLSVGGGPAMVIPMGPMWDSEIELHGFNMTKPFAESGGRKIKWVDCTFPQANAGGPSLSLNTSYHNCQWLLPNVEVNQVDKLIEYLEMDTCEGQFQVPSSPTNTFRAKNVRGVINGTSRRTHITDSDLTQLNIGPLLFGVADIAVVKNTYATYFDMAIREDDPGTGLSNWGTNVLASWTFSNGTFSRDLSLIPQFSGGNFLAWAIPGAKCFLNDEAGFYDNMGSPFVIMEVYMTGSVVNFDTSLKAIPTRQTQNSAATSSFFTMGSPGVVNWTAHGLAANTPVLFLASTITALPVGISPYTVYFVKSPAANSFNISATPGGAAINFTTFTATASMSGFMMTVTGSPSQNIQPGAVITGAGIAANTQIVNPVFTGSITGSVLTVTSPPPNANLAVGQTIWCPNLDINAGVFIASLGTGTGGNGTYNLSSAPGNVPSQVMVAQGSGQGGAGTYPISISQTVASETMTINPGGTQTVVANPLHIRPHPCPRFTGLGNTGTTKFTDLNGAIDEPMFSRMKRGFVGGHITAETNYLLPYGRIWGRLISCTINVIQAGTSGTFSISADGFTQPNLAYSAWTASIDLTTAGVRTIGPTAATTSTPLGTDSYSAFANWISGVPGPNNASFQDIFRFSGTPAAYNNGAIIQVDILTDQGITKYQWIAGSTSQVSNDADQIWIDSSLQSFAPS